eukprot:scaffold61215_cov37-Prasinocladus_malaysianus.AAC.1
MTIRRRKVEVKKGDTIQNFLRKVREQLAPEFREMRTAEVANMMYIKVRNTTEDLIIPNSFTFYELIINKARGKSGPLFNFDVHEDIRVTNDASKEKNESHAGKVVERHWYDRNKHIFPASRWETFLINLPQTDCCVAMQHCRRMIQPRNMEDTPYMANVQPIPFQLKTQKSFICHAMPRLAPGWKSCNCFGDMSPRKCHT